MFIMEQLLTSWNTFSAGDIIWSFALDMDNGTVFL